MNYSAYYLMEVKPCLRYNKAVYGYITASSKGYYNAVSSCYEKILHRPGASLTVGANV